MSAQEQSRMLKTVPIKGFIFIGSADGHLPHFARQETDRFCFVMQLSCRSEEKKRSIWATSAAQLDF
ncbi:MAG: hypothetical protein DMF47_09300 [Verrucomicrobia bacterium]|nr:MAG: hypothetical protein DMF47_09300 [Verrucomicrobiota bacterium]